MRTRRPAEQKLAALQLLRLRLLQPLHQAGVKRRPGKRITSPEKWEINQLIKAGVLDVSEYPTFDAEDGQVCASCPLPVSHNMQSKPAC